MHQSQSARLARVVAVLAGVVAVALGASASPARAGDFTLKLSAPPAVVVGEPTLIHATGTIPVEYRRFAYWLSVVSIRPTVMPDCPANPWDAEQIANATGGSILVLTSREVPDANGNFKVPVGISPYAPGRALICAYTDDGETHTLATASLRLTVRPKGSAARTPASIKPPRVTRSGDFLNCSSGQWSQRPTRYAYVWFADGRRVGRGPRLEATGALRGRRVHCRVTASNAAGSRSVASAPVLVR